MITGVIASRSSSSFSTRSCLTGSGIPQAAGPIDAPSNVNTTFDILIQSPASAGFHYSWVVPSEAIRAGPWTVFDINGNAPCCVPLSEQVRTQIAQDAAGADARRAANVNVTGSLMGACNIASQTAIFTWCADLPSLHPMQALQSFGCRHHACARCPCLSHVCIQACRWSSVHAFVYPDCHFVSRHMRPLVSSATFSSADCPSD